MIVAENGSIDPTTQSNVVNNGVREDSWGFCQILRKYHPEVNDERFFTDWRWQMELCYKKYKGGTTFYGANHPERADRQLVWLDAK